LKAFVIYTAATSTSFETTKSVQFATGGNLNRNKDNRNQNLNQVLSNSMITNNSAPENAKFVKNVIY
jgi:hypothetical protein